MLNYRIGLEVEGIVSRQVAPVEDRGWQRFKALDSLVAQRLQKQRLMPNHLLFASSDNERPSMAAIFEQCSLLNGISDLWNAIVKLPIDHACFVQIVDQAPGISDPARMALEKSLLRVSPFPLDSFEELLEVQEQVYDTRIFSGVLLDRHGRLSYRDERDYFHKSESKQRRSLFIDADIREGKDPARRKALHGLDVKVQDFRQGLHGTTELFNHWDLWLSENGRNVSKYQRIYVYSHLKGLLPACWENLQKRGVAAEVVRLPQWIAHSNAIASFMEFLVAEVNAAAYIFVGLNGKCHFAEWIR
ncbi:MAG: hypothetical protein EOP07_01880 [Proteobacteria bacterium]|nr:MAG: hypothetical protein EOP07_01880 [Pseudomonadota bacterium]